MHAASPLLAVEAQTVNVVLTTAMWWSAILWFAFLGGCVGSFLNVVWDRLGTGEGFVYPGSRCSECDHELRWYHNLPVLGWLILRGRCYDCHEPIPVKHPLVEGLFAAAFITAGLLSPWL